MLKVIFSTFFIYNSIQAYQYIKDKYSYQYEDWLINYSNGFVRRGLIGELLIKISQIINANLQVILYLFLIFLLFVFYYKSLKIFSNLKHNFATLFLIFSPYYFFFYLTNHTAGVRKEFLLFIFFCYFVSNINIDNIKNNLWKYSLFSPILVLVHEGLFFYLPFFVLIVLFFLTNKKNFYFVIKNLIFTILLSSLIFCFSFLFKGSMDHVVSICNSLNGYVKETCTQGGAINELNYKLTQATMEVYKEHNLISILQWILITFYGFIPIIFLLKNSEFKTKLYLENLLKLKSYNFIKIFLLISFVCMLPLFFVAFDWGRWLSIYYHLTVFVIIFLIKNKMLVLKKVKLININKKIIIILFLYATFITPSVFNQISSKTENVFELNYIKLLNKFNQ